MEQRWRAEWAEIKKAADTPPHRRSSALLPAEYSSKRTTGSQGVFAKKNPQPQKPGAGHPHPAPDQGPATRLQLRGGHPDRSIQVRLSGPIQNMWTADDLLAAMRARGKFGPSRSRICGEGNEFPGQRAAVCRIRSALVLRDVPFRTDC